MTYLIVAFRNFAKAPNNACSHISLPQTLHDVLLSLGLGQMGLYFFSYNQISLS